MVKRDLAMITPNGVSVSKLTPNPKFAFRRFRRAVAKPATFIFPSHSFLVSAFVVTVS
jgi:hypothetical protein